MRGTSGSGVTAIPTGHGTPVTVAAIVLVAVSMPKTVPPAAAPTQARVPSVVIAIAKGAGPMGIAAITVCVAVSMTDTLLDPRLAT